MTRPLSEHDLLFAALALQTGLVSPDDLAAALAAPAVDEPRPLGEALGGQGVLAAEEARLLTELSGRLLERHGHDPGRAVAALDARGTLRQQLTVLTTRVEDAGALSTMRTVTHSGPPTAQLETVSHEAAGGPTPSAAPAGPVPPLRYRVLRPHARGGLGEVFVALDEELGREVALKEIQARHADHPENRARFLLEAEVTGRLEHPGIVPVYGLGTYPDGRPYYAMRFIKGESLSRAIRRLHEGRAADPGRFALDLRKLLRRFVDVCNAVAYAHSRGVLHRDLKPGNVMLGQYGETLLVDWGLAKLLGRSEAKPARAESVLEVEEGAEAPVTRGVIGTPAFMSPEQAGGPAAELTEASDVYSLGATLYALLAGQAPFTDRRFDRVLHRVQEGDFPPPRRVNPCVPEALEAVCLKAMALLPSDRHPSAEALGDEVERWLLGREQAGARAAAQVGLLEHANAQAVPLLLAALQSSYADVAPRLRELWDDPALPDGHRLRVGLAMLAADPALVRDRLVELMLRAEDPPEVVLARDTLAPFAEGLAAGLWERLRRPGAPPAERFRVLVALAAFHPDGAAWAAHADEAAAHFLETNPLHLGVWKQALEPVRRALLAPLGRAFRAGRDADRGRLAATVLADYARDRPEVLASLVLDADEKQHAALLPALRAGPAAALPVLEAVLDVAPAEGTPDAERDRLALRQATAAVTLLHLGLAEKTWPLLRHDDDPGRRSYLLHAFAAYGIDIVEIVRRLAEEEDVSARRALLLALGEYPPERLTAGGREELIGRLLRAYREDLDAGMHGAAEWLLRRWGSAGLVHEAAARLCGRLRGGRQWFVNAQGQTFSVVRGPVVFLMGSPEDEPERLDNERRRRKVIPRSFAVASRQVTVEEFRRFLADNPEVQHSYISKYAPEDAAPILAVTWFEAAQYCNWLSAREGLPASEWCYPPLSDIREGMRLPPAFLGRTGYRLPTEAEWEFACRAGATTARHYGRSERLLGKYAWYIHNSEDRTWPCGLLKPNDLGLFDMHGNIWEACHDVAAYALAGDEPEREVDDEGGGEVRGGVPRVLRGGSFHLLGPVVRCAYRHSNRPEARNLAVGLRVAQTIR